ncbi:MAG: flavin reductase [Victivallales bacterium]|nr:flavin reductase [Victivallales bacterium]
MKHIFIAIVLFLGVCLTAVDIPQKPRQKPLPVEEFLKNFENMPVSKDMGANFASRIYLGTAGNSKHYNSLTLGWGACGVLWSKPVAIIYIRENRYSHAYFEAEPVFTLSWYSKEKQGTLVSIFGGKSGRDTDKEKESGFTPVETPYGGVTYMEAERVVVCRRIMSQPVPKEFVPKELAGWLNKDGHIHTQYTGEVLGVWKRK